VIRLQQINVLVLGLEEDDDKANINLENLRNKLHFIDIVLVEKAGAMLSDGACRKSWGYVVGWSGP
jgi:hypothetical protein